MAGVVALFEVNPDLDRELLADSFKQERRVQVRDVLTPDTAQEVRKVLSRYTEWGLAWQAGQDGPHSLMPGRGGQPTREKSAEIGRKIISSVEAQEYAFLYAHFPMLTAYQEKWNEGSPHDLLLEYINSEPFLQLVQEVTGIPVLKKADAQATFYRPGHFLGVHADSHVAEGWRVAYVLNMSNENWRPEWGGYLQFHDDDGDVVAAYRPRFNALNLFAVPQKHSVSYVPPFAPPGRYAITGWFRDR